MTSHPAVIEQPGINGAFNYILPGPGAGRFYLQYLRSFFVCLIAAAFALLINSSFSTVAGWLIFVISVALEIIRIWPAKRYISFSESKITMRIGPPIYKTTVIDTANIKKFSTTDFHDLILNTSIRPVFHNFFFRTTEIRHDLLSQSLKHPRTPLRLVTKNKTNYIIVDYLPDEDMNSLCDKLNKRLEEFRKHQS